MLAIGKCALVQARSLPTASLRPMFMVFNALVYAVEVVLWVLAGLTRSDGTLALMRVISSAFIAVVSISAAIGFLLYGGRLFLMLRRCATSYAGLNSDRYHADRALP